jgi:Na+/melibiose symporter-like transporter
MDYFEWQNGFRAEAMVSVFQSLTRKLASTVGSALNSLILGRLGYDQNAVPGGQSEKVEYTIFALFSVIPSTLSLIGMIPKFFYDLNGEKRDRMYAELHERRAMVMHAEHHLGDEE